MLLHASDCATCVEEATVNIEVASVLGILLFVHFFLFVPEVAIPLADRLRTGQPDRLKGLTETPIRWKFYSSTLPLRTSDCRCRWRWWVVISQWRIINLQKRSPRWFLCQPSFVKPFLSPKAIAGTLEWVSKESASGISPVQQWSLHVSAYDCICSSTGTLPPILVLTH